MTKADPAQLFERNYRRDSRRDEWKHASAAAMEQQRFIGSDQELVESKTGGRGDVRHKRAEPKDAACDLCDFSLHTADWLRLAEDGVQPQRAGV